MSEIKLGDYGAVTYNHGFGQRIFKENMDSYPAPNNNILNFFKNNNLNQVDRSEINQDLNKKECKQMSNRTNERGLYQVILINPKESQVILNKMVICDKLEDVLLEADAGAEIKKLGLSISEVDKIINFLGIIRKTRKNKNGEVEIVSDDAKE